MPSDQRRWARGSGVQPLDSTVRQIRICVFDLLWLNGMDLRKVPLMKHKEKVTGALCRVQEKSLHRSGKGWESD